MNNRVSRATLKWAGNVKNTVAAGAPSAGFADDARQLAVSYLVNNYDNYV